MGGATDDRTRTTYTRPEGKMGGASDDRTRTTYTRPEVKLGGATDDTQHGSATLEGVTFQRASFERTIFSDCTFKRLTIGAIHHLNECHFSDYQIQRVPISTQPILASISRLPGPF